MENRQNPLEVLVGTTITINPQKILNKGLLFSKQDYVDIDRAIRAIKNLEEPKIAEVAISMENIHGKNQMAFTVTDGNHRIGLACLIYEEIDVFIVGVWIGETRRGFNKIKQQLGVLLKEPRSY